MTDTAQQTAAAENPDGCNTMAPVEVGIDWMAVVEDMSREHVARLATDASLLRVELASWQARYHGVRAAFRQLQHEHETSMKLLDEYAAICSRLEQENAALQDSLTEMKPAPARKAAPRKRVAARGR